MKSKQNLVKEKKIGGAQHHHAYDIFCMVFSIINYSKCILYDVFYN